MSIITPITHANAITFTIPGILPGWQRAGKSGKRHYTQERTAAAQREIAAWAWQAAQGRVLQGALGFHVTSYRPIPASASAARKTSLCGMWCPTKPDGDNLLKSLQDSCNGILWKDDAQIADARIVKLYDPLPRTEVTVWELD